MNDSTSIEPRVKRCSRGDECIHPQGPYLPVTEEYWYMSTGRPLAKCRECQKAYRRNYHSENKEQENTRSRNYIKQHPEQTRQYRARYQIRKLDNGGNFTHAELDTLYKQQKGCCWWCGAFVGLTFDIDHRVPVSRGGTSDISNMVISCPACNRSKSDKLPSEWNGRLL